MALRNVPKSYTIEQQRQEINSLAADVGDISQLASGLPSIVAAINQISLAGDDGGSLLSGTLPPTSADGANGDFYLDTATKELYGPKENGAWPASTISISEQILSGIVPPLSTLGKLNDYYYNSATKELYGPKTAQGWGEPTPLGDAIFTNVLYVAPNGDDASTGTSPSRAFKTIKAAARAAASMDGNTTIRVSTGKYYEENPIYLPKGTSIVGDNLRETIVIPKNEGKDIFWVTSGCYINYMVFEDNFNGGLGYLETEQSDNRILSASDTQFRVLPGHTLSRVLGVFFDGSNLIEYQKQDIIDNAISDMLVQFPSLPSNPDYDLTTCQRDLGYIVDGLVHDLRNGGNIRSVKNGEAYRDENGELISAIVGEEIELIYAIERVSYWAQEKILTVPAGFEAAGYPAVQQDIAGYPECSKVQDSIDTLSNIVISIIQGGDIPQYVVGPGYILIDQEWMKVVNFNTTTNELIVQRAQNNPITGESTVAAKHVTGAFVSQNGFTWRYAVAYPDQNGIRGKGRVNLSNNNPVVTGNVSTKFTEEIQVGWKIKVGANEYTVSSITNDSELVLSAPVPVGQAATLDIYYIIPPKERIFLSPYTQNCSCISKLGRAVFDSNTGEYDASKTRAGGLLADGAQLDSNSPLESMVVDAFTQIVFGSIGFHLKNDAYAQLVSVFQVFEAVGVLAESGGYASITNSATNFGLEGLKAIGFSNNVLPIFAGGQVSNVENITKTDINTLPSSIVSTTFSSAVGGTKTRATIEVSIVDVGKFERGQAITISNHVSTPLINGVGRIVDTVDFQNNLISIVLDEAWDPAYETSGGLSTGEITISSGSIFTRFTVTGYQAPPIPNYIIKIPGLGLDPTGNEQVVGEVISYDEGNNTQFTTNFPLTTAQVNAITNNASIQLFAPSTVNSSSHTYEYVGSGINYTAFPQNGGITVEAAQDVEVNSGKTYVSATDQSGNFSVGPFFNVNLRSGKVTFNGSVALGVLDSLQLKGSPGVPIFEFSPDDNLGGPVGRADTVLPTQKAVRDYINKSSVLGNFIGLNKGTASIPGLIVQLDSTGKIDAAQIPSISQFTVYTVETSAERLQDYIPITTKQVVSNTANTITLNSVANLSDGLTLTGTDIPTNTKIVIGGIDVVNNIITVDQTLPTLTVGQNVGFIGAAVKAGDIVVQKNEADGDPNTILQTWILSQLPATEEENWELLALNQIDAAAIISGIVSPSRLGTGVPNDDTYLNGISKYTPVVKGILPPTASAITVAGTREILKKTGNPIDISSATWAVDTATYNTATPHLLSTGDYVEIESIHPDTFNGTYQVTVVDSDTFTVAKSTNPGSYINGGKVTVGNLHDSGFVELDVNAVSYTTGQVSGSSSLGVSRYKYSVFSIDSQNVVDVRDKGLVLGKIQNIAPRSLLGNPGLLPANPGEIEIGVGVSGVPTFDIELSNNRYTVLDYNISQDLGILPDLQIIPGREYVFRLGDVTGHPFNIVTSPGAIGANLYTTGVVGNGNESNSTVRFTCPQNAPPFLYYQSGLDAANFGVLKIVKISDNLEVVDSTSSATITLDQFAKTAVNTVEYLIQIKNTPNPTWIHSTKIMVLHDGTDVYMSEYATLFTNKLLGSFTVDMSGNNVRLRYTPAFDNNDYLNRLIIQKNYVIS
jgi:hypothetical protein